MQQPSPNNLDVEVLVTATDVASLRDLMPYRWPVD
ncbi:hypothetical protein ABH936_001846 [Dermacoccus sp. GAS27A]